MSQLTHIDSGIRIVGSITGSGDVVVAGHVQGSVQTQSAVVIEPGGVVEGDILGQKVLVRGVVVGSTDAVDVLEVSANGQLVGDVRTRRVQLRAGGRISGQVSTGMEIKPFQAQGLSSGRGAQLSTGFGRQATRLVSAARVAPPRATVSPRAATAPARVAAATNVAVPPKATVSPAIVNTAAERPPVSQSSGVPPRPIRQADQVIPAQSSAAGRESAAVEIVEDEALPFIEVVETTPQQTKQSKDDVNVTETS